MGKTPGCALTEIITHQSRIQEPERSGPIDQAAQPADEAARPEELSALPPDVFPWLTIVVPIKNNPDSVEDLLRYLAASMGPAVAEVLFVDDSTDKTPDVIRGLAPRSGLAVRLLHRPRRARAGGLASAVVAGFKHVRSPWAVVMDCDTQPPPELITTLVAVGQSRHLDLVVGNGHHAESGARPDSPRHGAVSSFASRLSKSLFPRRLSRLSDPMSSLFAVRLAALDLDRLNPIGSTTLLEIAVRQPRLQTAEVPFIVEPETPEQKLSASPAVGLQFLRHVMRLRLGVLRHQVNRSASTGRVAWMRRLVVFGMVGATGVVVNELALWLLSMKAFNHHYLLAAVLATEASTTWNFVLTELVVFRGPKPRTLIGRGIRFYLLNHVALLLRLPLLAFLVGILGIHLLIGNLITLVLLFFVRFLVADAAIYATTTDVVEKVPMRITVDLSKPQASAASQQTASTNRNTEPARSSSRYLPYRYAIDGIVTIGSQVPLLELEYFRAQWVGNDPDLSIRVGSVGRGTPRTRALMTQYVSPPGLSYQEHFGRLGANFRVEIGDKVAVTCSPTLARSPHVLYTNVVEALLRFLSVSRGFILLHSACLEIGGQGLLLSARTDTGKTGTVLKLLRERDARFLSDDMTIMSPDGVATCFPKPLTISHHTLRAVNAGDLSASEWRRLRLQSRLHSKEGRDFGMMLAGLNIPIMGVNSLTQRIIPPPKYQVDRLVECRVIRTTRVSDLFVIERGAPALTEVGFDEAVQTLVENTDDAYGFPPFREMAPSIVIGEDDYEHLRGKEREILASAVSNIRIRRLASDTFSWADDIAALLHIAPTASETIATTSAHA
jgi:putative flippase GtrA